MRHLTIALLVAVVVGAFSAVAAPDAYARELAGAFERTAPEGVQEPLDDEDLARALDQKRSERQTRASVFNSRSAEFDKLAQAFNAEHDRILRASDDLVQRMQVLLNDIDHYNRSVTRAERLTVEVNAMTDGSARDEKVLELEDLVAWLDEESERIRELELRGEADQVQLNNDRDAQNALRPDMDSREAWLREERQAILRMDDEIAGLEAELARRATRPERDPRRTEAPSNTVSASDLSEASVIVLRQIREIEDLGGLSQQVLLFGTVVDLLSLRPLSDPVGTLVSWLELPDDIEHLNTLSLATACLIRTYTMRRVIDGRTGREAWKTDRERRYFEALDGQSRRICSRLRR